MQAYLSEIILVLINKAMRQKVYKTETCVPGECWSDGEAAGMCK
jgi:hypothetical protein